ncbi:hypothetical protein Dred_3092 [Desulforamulus reducens MI-1]|uniref:Uncharacterized protein n=1 Tax=Desulforamulus reducens (strain ATCC BAA-1160 / DSM 100696 / MI-1) TaxID=349161 RepID=A4J941_DESRM|nr:hypothetical protein [Desulforamulus reducens]ABO51594.1 hypothetical protein Dred_3092 [Desulforamulus reducens MI-1]
MRGFSKGGRKPMLWLIMTLLLTLAMAIPAQAAITSATVTVDNPTITVESNYFLDITADTELSVNDEVYVNLDNCYYDLSKIQLNNIEVSVNDTVYSTDSQGQLDNNTLIIPVGTSVNAGDKLRFVIKGLSNPAIVGNHYYFAYGVQINGVGWAPLNSLNIVAPKVTLTPYPADIEVNLRDKIVLSLSDAKDNPFLAPHDVNVYLSSNNMGNFYQRSADGWYCYGSSTIPQGSSSLEVFYRPEVVGEHQISVQIYEWNSNNPSQTIIKALPTGATKVLVNNDGAPYDRFWTTAGAPKKLTFTAYDQYGNPVKQTNDLRVKLTVLNAYYNEISDTGAFYTINPDGSKGSPIQEAVIQAGNDSVDVYYYDTKATDWRNQYYVAIYTQITPNCSTFIDVMVDPAVANRIDLKVLDNERYTTYGYGHTPPLYIANNEGRGWEVECEGGVQNNLLSEMIFPVQINMLDEFNNSKKLDTPLTLDLSLQSVSDDVYGSFFENINYDYWNGATVYPIDHIQINAGESSKTIYFVARGAGAATIKALAPNFGEGTFDINLIGPDHLSLQFPYENAVQPEGRVPFIVLLKDAEGHPAWADKEINVNLNGGNFYEDERDTEPVTTVTIPKGCHGVQVYLEGPENEGTISISATDAGNQYGDTGDVVVKVEEQPYFCTYLERGWNTLSTPIALDYDRKSIQDAIEKVSNILVTYKYDEVQRKWLLVYERAAGDWRIQEGIGPTDTDPKFTFEPQEAVFVKMKGDSEVHFYASKLISAPPTRQLVTGWNLVSPAISLEDEDWDSYQNAVSKEAAGGAGAAIQDYYEYGVMPAYKVLISIKDKYAQVVSPSLVSQEAWTYIPPNIGLVGDLELLLSGLIGNQTKYMEAGRGYWVYMKENGELAGFSSTPVYDYHYKEFRS